MSKIKLCRSKCGSKIILVRGSRGYYPANLDAEHTPHVCQEYLDDQNSDKPKLDPCSRWAYAPKTTQEQNLMRHYK